MIADKSTGILIFFIFFTGLGKAGLAARSEQLFNVLTWKHAGQAAW